MIKIEFIKFGVQTKVKCDLCFLNTTVYFLTNDLFKKSIEMVTRELKNELKITYICKKSEEFCKNFDNAVNTALISFHKSFKTKETTINYNVRYGVTTVYRMDDDEIGIIFFYGDKYITSKIYGMWFVRTLQLNDIDKTADYIIRDIFQGLNIKETFNSNNAYDVIWHYDNFKSKVSTVLYDLFLNNQNYKKYLGYK